MKGRQEHSLKIEDNIKNILYNLPQYVTEYYYEFKSGRQPAACREYIRKISKFLYFINPDNVIKTNPLLFTKFNVAIGGRTFAFFIKKSTKIRLHNSRRRITTI